MMAMKENVLIFMVAANVLWNSIILNITRKKILWVLPFTGKKLCGHSVNRKKIIDTLWLNKEISKTDKAIIFERYPLLYEISAVIKEFRYIFEHGCIQSLYLFIEKHMHSNIKKVAKFSKGLLTDLDAIENAVGNSLSNAFVEGNNNRLKTIKRTMYGRANFPLLRAKVLC